VAQLRLLLAKNMMTIRPFLLLVFLGAAGSLLASPGADLASPSQQTRDAAASLLLASYTPPARTNWDSLVATLKVGDSKTKILEQLKPFNAGLKSEWGFAAGDSCVESYRLDDLWLLECHFYCSSNTLVERKLADRLRDIWVEPPPKFTGVWTTYYVNGRKSHEIHFTDGKYDGEYAKFGANGSKLVVQHYTAGIAEGEETGYFPSGQIMYRGGYKAGVQVGTWTWYNADGSVRSTQNHAAP
jgi:antitoxin component YwqK of YwqJK toxin-antitoxin module